MRHPTTLALAAVVPVTMAGMVLAAPAAYADDRTCKSSIGAQDVDGDVIVPQGATCTLTGTRVDGNVLVRSGATLVARGVQVGGNVQAEDHKSVTVRHRVVDDKIRPSRIGGSIQLKQGGGGELLRNVVGGDIQLFSNDGQFVVSRNVVDGNLQCKSNDPKPTGSNNQVEGNKEDQCKNL